MGQVSNLNFVFINPNSPSVFRDALMKITLEKLLAKFSYPEIFSSADEKS